ncbi:MULTISPECIES: glycosyltransferase [unclassified Mycobacterium]|uniref:glycosyltransferase n=1 Tax=unclassified Mycobacterium TaxID=2642494 RepID=UPI0029C68CA1|nr:MULTISPECIES: glycosyltransferase [unclassified Mycobacterium]
MKFVLASYGTRGDIEPCVAVGRELLRRGHDVRMAVPPDLSAFAESAGLPAVAYGPDLQEVLDVHREFWTRLFRNFWKVRDLIRLWRETWEPAAKHWEEMSATLTSLADEADLLFTGLSYQEVAANVAEHHDIPLATLHYFPIRANGRLLASLPAPVARLVMTVYEWLAWRTSKKLDDAQRRQLGLPKAKTTSPRRIAERRSLELQAYDEVCFPGLADEWAQWNGQRPFVGALTMELTTDADDEVASWIASGKPPIFFGFGSIPVVSPAETVAMIDAACAELGERALIGSGSSDFSQVAASEHVKVVGVVNYSTTFPRCRAVVHHGGAGTTAASLRAGVPTLILSTDLDQTLWGSRVKRLKVGTARRLSATTRESLVVDLRTVLTPQYASRARELSTHMTKSVESISTAADLVEDFARATSERQERR